ncbi:MAG: hypothetical protein U0441_35510 [Polyangiaceae bacterium]
MLRTARGIAPSLRALTLVATTACKSALPLMPVAAAAVSAVTVVGCADENDPQTHVDRLKDPATRPGAVNRLVQFFEDAMTRDDKNREGPTVKPLLDKIVKPMNEVCVGGDLDERTNSKLIKFMSDARHPDGEPCLVKALKDYKPDSTEEDIRWAARAVSAMKLKSAAGPLIDVFLKMKPSKPKAGAMYRDVYDAMDALDDPSWESQLVAILDKPISDPKKREALIDEVQWQTNTAAMCLGHLKSEKAVPGLLKVMLTPAKADAQATAIRALIKIGKPSSNAAIALLSGQNADLVKYATEEAMKAYGDKPNDSQKKSAQTAYIATAALVLATIGREESVAPLLAALDKADDTSRAIIARELTKVPGSPEVLKAFQTAFEKTSTGQSIPPGQGAREALLDAAGMFFDASLVPWLIKQAQDMKGEEDNLGPIRESTLITAAKLMKADQIDVVDKLYSAKPSADALKKMNEDAEEDMKAAKERLSKAKDDKEKEAANNEIKALEEQKKGVKTFGSGMSKEWKLAKDLLAACTNNVDCYIAKAADPASQAEDTQFQGIKSMYMIGELGDASVKQKLLDNMPKFKNAAIRFLAVQLIDRLSPKGDVELAKKLQAIVDEAETKKDAQMMAANAPFKDVIYRLNARAN